MRTLEGLPLNLTTGLIALAVLVLVGIVAQGLWKARRIEARSVRRGGLDVVRAAVERLSTSAQMVHQGTPGASSRDGTPLSTAGAGNPTGIHVKGNRRLLRRR